MPAMAAGDIDKPHPRLQPKPLPDRCDLELGLLRVVERKRERQPVITEERLPPLSSYVLFTHASRCYARPDTSGLPQCARMSLTKDLGEKPLEPLECLRPARLVQRASGLGREWPLVEHEPRALVMIEEHEHHRRHPVVGIRLLPLECVDETPRRIDLGELAAQVERLALRRLHRDAVPPSAASVELDAGSGETSRTPPLSELLRLDARREHALGWRSQDLLQMEAEAATGVSVHAGDYASVRPRRVDPMSSPMERAAVHAPGATTESPRRQTLS